MSQLRVVLADLVFELDSSHSERVTNPAPLRSTLQTLFDKVIASQRSNPKYPIRSVKVEWWSTAYRGGSKNNRGRSPLSLSPRDLIVYFVRNPDDSVTKQFNSTSGKYTGWTTWTGKTTATEVYTARHRDNPVGLAKLAFHELMHFASHKKNHELHNLKKHDNEDMSFSASTVTAGTKLKQGDILFMADNLQKNNREPWTDGFLKYVDPTRNRI